jgi:mRNA interferase MazF
MEMKRGDLVTIALPGDLGKPRPALIVQSDLFEAHPSLTLLPLTTEMRGDLHFRITVAPNSENGLRTKSQVMVDKIQSVARARIGAGFGRLSTREMVAVDRAMTLFLGLA